MKVFGYIRFSYLGRSDVRMWKENNATFDAYFDKLYDPLRMELRFHFFEHICLPSLTSQTDQDFVILVLASKAMPQAYKTRLESVVSSVPQVEIIYEDAELVIDAFAPTAQRYAQDLTENSVHFRLDDDDGIGRRFIEVVKEMGTRAKPGTIISLPRGFNLLFDGETPTVLPNFQPYASAGFAFVNAPDNIRNPYAASHLKAHQKSPAMLDPTLNAYIYVSHIGADTISSHSRRLRNLKSQFPDFSAPAAQDKLKNQVSKAFPHTSVEELCAILANAPNETP